MLPLEKSGIERRIQKQNILIYGRAKIGKSTLASNFPNPIFLATEPGLNHLSVFKVNINSWEKFLEACKDVAEGKHKFETVILDTIDNLVVYCSDYICRSNGIKHPSELAHGRGWNLITTELTRSITKLAGLPYGLVMISHSDLIEVETRTRKFHRYTISIGGKNRNLFLNMTDLILFIDSEVEKDGTEKRFIRTKPSMYWEAGDRSNTLAEVIPLSYKSLASYFTTEETPKPKEEK